MVSLSVWVWLPAGRPQTVCNLSRGVTAGSGVTEIAITWFVTWVLATHIDLTFVVWAPAAPLGELLGGHCSVALFSHSL